MSAPVARRTLAILLGALLVALLGTAVAGASGKGRITPSRPVPSAEDGVRKNESPRFWFVEYPSAPLADGASDASLAGDDDRFKSEARSEKVSFKERLRFKSLWNGVSIEAKPGAIAKIRTFASVKAVYPVRTYSLPKEARISPDLATAVQMTGADIAQNELGLTGKGVRVAVMDSGIDYQHPDLGGGFGPGKRVTTGWDFVGDAFDADPESPGYNPVPVPDPDPDDCDGHGTHVAGIIGAKGKVTGVAPGVTFGAYRVFGCSNTTSDDVMLAAMERVLRDRMDVLNMSIGDAFNNWPGTPTAAAADRLVRKGVVVVASIGNSGTSGLWAAGAPGVGDRVIGVASFDNVQGTNFAFSATPDGALFGYDPASGAPTTPQTGTLPLDVAGVGAPANQGCSPYTGKTGKAVLVRRGGCTFAVKAGNAQAAGAAAVILYNNTSGRINPTVASAVPPITIPVVAVTQADGEALAARVAGGATSITWTSETVASPIATGGLLSDFSSFGLAADLSLKPDIGAPGGYVWSTFPLEKGGYASESGTSMASPHVAGAVALLLQSRASLRRGDHGSDDDRGKDDGWRSNRDDGRNLDRAATIRDILQNSADPQDFSFFPGFGLIDNVQRQGAGMLDIVGAVEATSAVTPGKLSLGESTGPVSQRVRVVNNGKTTVSYTLGHLPALANGPEIFEPSFWDSYATVAFDASSFSLKPGDSRTVRVTVTPPADLEDGSIYGGYVEVTPSVGDVLRVPYAGFKGDYQAISILDNEIGLPALTDVNYDDPSGPFSLVDEDNQPLVVWHQNLQARRLVVTVVTAAGKTLGRAFDVEYMPRNSTSTTFFEQPWDGTYMPGERSTKVKTAPDGDYKLVLSVEKPLAQRNNPAHVETWESPVFTIDRP